MMDESFPATVSDFRLDTYEITVGRFRQFVEQYPASKPAAGAGAHPLIAGSGWDPAWTPRLRADKAALQAALTQNCSSYHTWTDAPGANEARPINCITWYEAFAFCAWDGGRLPTEAEWNYAAAGGSQQWLYPWGNTIDHEHAVYDCKQGSNCNTSAAFGLVGSKPSGDGRWGQSVLAGNVWELTLDWHRDYPLQCDNCANITEGHSRVRRGGALQDSASFLFAAYRGSGGGLVREDNAGARCARNP